MNRQPNLDLLLATLISKGAKEIEVKRDIQEWWVSVIEENAARGVVRYRSENMQGKVERALERLRKERSIDVKGMSYSLSFILTERFGLPSWRIRISEKVDRNRTGTRAVRAGRAAFQAERPVEHRDGEETPNTIYTLSIRCVSGAYLKETFLRVVEVPSDTTLGDLHFLMQDLTSFDNDHMSTFYMANQYPGRIVWLTESGEYEDGHDAIADGPLWDIPLQEIFPLPKHKKLYYWFDFGDDWVFEIRKKGRDGTAVAGVEYPRVIHEEGPKPEQYPPDEK